MDPTLDYHRYDAALPNNSSVLTLSPQSRKKRRLCPLAFKKVISHSPANDSAANDRIIVHDREPDMNSNQPRPSFPGQMLLETLEADIGDSMGSMDKQQTEKCIKSGPKNQILSQVKTTFQQTTKPKLEHFGELTGTWCLPAGVGSSHQQRVKAHEKKVNPQDGSEPFIWSGSAWFRCGRRAVSFDDIPTVLSALYFSPGSNMGPPSRKLVEGTVAARYEWIYHKDIAAFIKIANPYWNQYWSAQVQPNSSRQLSKPEEVEARPGKRQGTSVTEVIPLTETALQQKLSLPGTAPSSASQSPSQPPGSTNGTSRFQNDAFHGWTPASSRPADIPNGAANPFTQTNSWTAFPAFSGTYAPASFPMPSGFPPGNALHFGTGCYGQFQNGTLFAQPSGLRSNDVNPFQSIQQFQQPFATIHGAANTFSFGETVQGANNKAQTQSKSDPLKLKSASVDVSTRKVPGGTSRPAPSFKYYQEASRPLTRLSSPQKLLIISDLNGTLIARPKKQLDFIRRPGLTTFLEYLFGHHKIMIWTSAKPETTHSILPRLFPPEQLKECSAVWARDTLGLTQNQYNQKVQVYKKLGDVWANEAIQSCHPRYAEGGRWDQSNTLLVDDSESKAIAQPYSLINIPEFSTDKVAQEVKRSVLAQVAGYIEEARWWSDVSAFAKLNAFKVGKGWECKARAAPNHSRVGAGVGEPDVSMS